MPEGVVRMKMSETYTGYPHHCLAGYPHYCLADFVSCDLTLLGWAIAKKEPKPGAVEHTFNPST